jgi:DNA processing protein
VLAVPGEITSALSHGTNALLRLGATPVTGVEDVLEVLGLERREDPVDLPPGGTAAAVLAAVDEGARTADELARGTCLSAAAVAAALVELELAGLVSASSGVYRR